VTQKCCTLNIHALKVWESAGCLLSLRRWLVSFLLHVLAVMAAIILCAMICGFEEDADFPT